MLTFERLFTKECLSNVWSTVEWKHGPVKFIKNNKEFTQQNVEYPATWSDRAVKIMVDKYFYGKLDDPKRESSVKQVFGGIAETITAWGLKDGYFDQDNAIIFKDELIYIMLHQMCMFNSPVLFNCRIKEKPQCSACFIIDVEDSMEGIADAVTTEAKIFKNGSGSGMNISSLRSSYETLSGGGFSSGPIPFMKGFDMLGGAIKSGGRTRRSAKMVIMNIWHPDILEQSDGRPGFIKIKALEEKKAWDLRKLGYDTNFGSETLACLQYQNANNTVRVDDDFMHAILMGEDYDTRSVTTDTVVKTYKAQQMFDEIVAAAWECGDPGLQFHTIINNMNTCPHIGEIVASNPCGEFCWLNNNSCNLASIDLLRLFKDKFNIVTFEHIIDIFTTAQDILVDNAYYPINEIAINSANQRPLGLGHCDAGGLLMKAGLPYDSDNGRKLVSAITSLMTARAYLQSSKIAEVKGSFKDFNYENMLPVLEKHAASTNALLEGQTFELSVDILNTAIQTWNIVLTKKEFRNAQATLIAPTGTISMIMDAITTGPEPEYAIIKEKFLEGGGSFIIINSLIKEALNRLGYNETETSSIIEHIKTHKTIEGSAIRYEHLPVFDCANAAGGKRSISAIGHIRMMAAIQPFVSGAISKTVNLPHTATKEEIADIFMKSWRMGLKSITVYRDGSKASQPLVTAEHETQKTLFWGEPKPLRKWVKTGFRHSFTIGGQAGYIHPGFFEDGSLAEIFVEMDCGGGNTIGGLINCACIAISNALQYGCPPEKLMEKFAKQTFQPMGFTDDDMVRTANNIMDYVFKRVMLTYGTAEVQKQIMMLFKRKAEIVGDTPVALPEPENGKLIVYGPPCTNCGHITQRAGSCYVCPSCGTDTGCSG